VVRSYQGWSGVIKGGQELSKDNPAAGEGAEGGTWNGEKAEAACDGARSRGAGLARSGRREPEHR